MIVMKMEVLFVKHTLSLSFSISEKINSTCHIGIASRHWLPLGKERGFWTILDKGLATWALC